MNQIFINNPNNFELDTFSNILKNIEVQQKIKDILQNIEQI